MRVREGGKNAIIPAQRVRHLPAELCPGPEIAFEEIAL
jgi:hypothetical protein